MCFHWLILPVPSIPIATRQQRWAHLRFFLICNAIILHDANRHCIDTLLHLYIMQNYTTTGTCMLLYMGMQEGTQIKCLRVQNRTMGKQRVARVYMARRRVHNHIGATRKHVLYMQYVYIYIQLALGNARSNNKVLLGETLSQQRYVTNSDQVYWCNLNSLVTTCSLIH